MTFDNKKVSDPQEIANRLNEHFASVGTRLASKLPEDSKHFRDYIKPARTTFDLKPTNEKAVFSILTNMSASKATGLDNISLCLSLSLSLCLCLSLSLSLSVCLSVCLSVSLSLSLFVSVSVCLSVCLSLSLSLSLCLSVSLCLSLSVSLSLCLPVSLLYQYRKSR